MRSPPLVISISLERLPGFEPGATCLGSRHSATELQPRAPRVSPGSQILPDLMRQAGSIDFLQRRGKRSPLAAVKRKTRAIRVLRVPDQDHFGGVERRGRGDLDAVAIGKAMRGLAPQYLDAVAAFTIA